MSSSSDLRLFDSREALSQAAAELIVETAARAQAKRGRFLLALSGGGTPEPVFRLLAGDQYRTRLEQAATHFFWGDERCVPPGDPGSNFGQAKGLLLDRLNVPAAQIHRIKGELAPGEAAAEYRRQLAAFAAQDRDWPVLDLALMGMGSDGHTASLFPGPPHQDEDKLAAIAVTADYGGRPAQRVSLTPPLFNDARNVLFLATGASKAEAIAAVLGADPDQRQYPAARIAPTDGRLHFYLDQAAAQLLE